MMKKGPTSSKRTNRTDPMTASSTTAHFGSFALRAGALILALAFALLCCGCVKEHASEETKALGRKVLDRMLEMQESPFANGAAPEGMDYAKAREQIPELAEFESMPDAPLALVELYEEFEGRLRAVDWKGMERRIREAAGRYDVTVTDDEGADVMREQQTMETLLASEEYFERLTPEQKRRLNDALSGVYGVLSDALSAENVQQFFNKIKERMPELKFEDDSAGKLRP